MSSSVANIESLVYSLVPQARVDDNLKRELVDHCKDILSSHFGQSRDQDIGHLANLVQRQLLQSSPAVDASLRFTNLLSRLLDQPVLSKKHASLLFLHTLASSTRPSNAPDFLPSIAPPPPAPKPSAAPSPISRTTSATAPRGKTKAEMLKEYRTSRGRPHLPEHLLLRDTLYLLQGISGKHVTFSAPDNSDERSTLVFVDDPRNSIPAPTRTLIHRLAEVGHLYKRVDAFIRVREHRTGVGMIEQSLCHHLQAQLTEYYRLIAVLESQMAGTPAAGAVLDGVVSVGGLATVAEEEHGLTLRRLDVWINEWRLRMRMMSVCVEGARDAHGGALVNLIHSYTATGDPFVRHFTDVLLEDVSAPFFASLHRWLFSGELYDPFEEFFVAVDPELVHVRYVHPSSLAGAGGLANLSADGGFAGLGGDADVSGDREGGLSLWQNKYQFRKDMLPAFVGEAFGKKIFSTGKSLNFIRYSCHDSDWVTTREKLGATGDTLKYSDISGLERSIDAAYKIASQRLFDVFFDKFKLLVHLRALKNYLMLGHGDFADQLMDTLGPSLARPANTLYRHNLTATLETAIRSSNAHKDGSDVLRRLDVRMLEYSHGELGWDVFTLEYKVDPPIDAVVDPDAMVKYLKLFSHLWKIKRIEGTLSKAWMRTTSGTKSFLRVPELEHEWHQIRIIMAEMIHFIRQMQAYCQLEVIECSWKELLDFVHKKEGDLDSLIDAHRSYLDRMVKKILLLSPKAGREENLLNQVRDIFATILQFREATDNFYNYCLSESARRDRGKDEARGVYTGARHDNDNAAAPDALPQLLGRVKEYGSTFSEQAQAIVHGLQVHHDLDCRFLGIRLSFSDFYKTKKDIQQLQHQRS